MGGGGSPDLTWCDPSDQTFYFVCGISVSIGMALSFYIYMRLRTAWPKCMDELGCLGFSSLLCTMAIVLAFLGSQLVNEMVPSVEACGTTDRHVLPFMVGLLLLPSVIAGAVSASLWKSQ
jgi:hypothetical protein